MSSVEKYLKLLPPSINGWEISEEHGMLFLNRPGASQSEGIYLPEPAYQDGTLFLMHFGVYGEPRMLVWARSFEKALEEGAYAAKKISPDVFEEITAADIKAGKEEISEETGRPVDEISDEEAGEHMTADLTYTEAGWIMEWGGGEPDDELYDVVDQIYDYLEGEG